MLVMKLKINITGVQEVVGAKQTARMILFDGTAESDFFNGVIEPGGVDTQIDNRDGTGTLSARYSLHGTDREGNAARVFIENNAEYGKATNPRVWTDSPALRFLETAPLRGHIMDEDGQLTILIETVEA
ncbi:MAG: DUF3237 domain-containing protein [Clostridia bacterium]|nr:DUF3237 domain-containing protein [Clostridia bacterium]